MGSGVTDRFGVKSISGSSTSTATSRRNPVLQIEATASSAEVEDNVDRIYDEVSRRKQSLDIDSIDEEAIVQSLIKILSRDLAREDDDGRPDIERAANNDGNHKPASAHDAVINNSIPDTDSEISINDSVDDVDPRAKTGQLTVATVDGTCAEQCSLEATTETECCETEAPGISNTEIETKELPVRSEDGSKDRISQPSRKPALIKELGIAPIGPDRSKGLTEAERMMEEIGHSRSSIISEVKVLPKSEPEDSGELPMDDDLTDSNQLSHEDATMSSFEQIFIENPNLVLEDEDTVKPLKAIVQNPVSRDIHNSSDTKHFVPIIYVSSVAGLILALVACYLYCSRYSRRRRPTGAFSQETAPTKTTDSEESTENPFSTVVQMQSPGKLNVTNSRRNNIFTF